MSRGAEVAVSRRAILAGVAALASAPLGACGGDGNLVPVTARTLDPGMVDRDPLALLPSGAVGLLGADAKALFATPLGAEVTQVVRELVPLGPEAGFEPSRDVDRVTAGFYAMQGVDLCAVVQGRFDAAAIERAADAKKVMPTGKAIVKTRYADQTMFTVGNLGFSVLSPRTMLSGNEIGMRRALDRLRFGTTEEATPTFTRALTPWMLELVETPQASFAFAGDFSASSVSEAATKAVPFLAGLDRMRVLGNFQQPGLNFAGTLTYRDDAAADAGGATIKNLSDMGQIANLWTTLAMGTSIPSVDVRRSGKDLAFTTAVDAGTSKQILRWVADHARSSL